MPSESSLQALEILRDGSQFSWYVIPLLLIVMYLYTFEIDRGNWNRVLAGLAFWGMDWFNEIWNSLLFHFSGFAPAWGAPDDTAFLIFIGLNIEICFMFAITGLMATLALPKDKNMKIMGINNRLFIASIFSIMSVGVEMILNSIGALTWDWPWWNRDAPWLIFLFGYMPFYLMCYWVYDMTSRKKQIATVGGIYTINGLAILIFGVGFGWL
tara:strand:- start:6792 stop:7427 length:636 start_codon:yes stop_codon:yes gene_type:complete